MKGTLLFILASMMFLLFPLNEETISIEEERQFGWTDVTITTYNPVSSQCDGTPLVTACMAEIDTVALRKKELRWCAVSRDLFDFYSYGDTIDLYISDGHRYNGKWIVKDTMNKRYTKTIDLLTFERLGKWKGKIK